MFHYRSFESQQLLLEFCKASSSSPNTQGNTFLKQFLNITIFKLKARNCFTLKHKTQIRAWHWVRWYLLNSSRSSWVLFHILLEKIWVNNFVFKLCTLSIRNWDGKLFRNQNYKLKPTPFQNGVWNKNKTLCLYLCMEKISFAVRNWYWNDCNGKQTERYILYRHRHGNIEVANTCS